MKTLSVSQPLKILENQARDRQKEDARPCYSLDRSGSSIFQGEGGCCMVPYGVAESIGHVSKMLHCIRDY